MNSEMEAYQKELKENINLLIEKNRLEDAKELLRQYEKIISEDVDIYSIKGVIAIMEGELDEAERVLKAGVVIQPFNYDILYNLAYLYEAAGKYITAYRYYNKALKVAEKEVIADVTLKIEELMKIEKVKQYAGRKKVLFIAHIFPPVGGSGVQRSMKFVKYLRDFGWEPVVVTVGNTIYPFKDETMVAEIPEEIEVIRINEREDIDTEYANKLVQLYGGLTNTKLIQEYIEELNKSQENLNQLLLQPDPYILWATEVLDKIGDTVDFSEIDMIYTTSGPYSDHVIGYYLKLRYYKPWVADFRDEWTNNPYGNFNKNHIWYRLNYVMESNIVHKADKVIAVTPISKLNYEKIFKLQPEKVHEITNGYDEDDFIHVINKTNKNKKFTMMHNGMLYMVRTPSTFMQAIRNLIKNGKIKKSNIKIVFGWTENVDKWTQIRDELELGDVVDFLEYLTHEESLKKANESDVLLLIVGTGEKNKSVFPGKTFEYLRLCKPILALSPQGSVVERLIKNTNRGKNIEFDNIKQIEKCILEMYMEWERDLVPKYEVDERITKFERKNLTEHLSRVLIEAFDQYQEQEINEISQLKEKNSNFYDELFESGGWNETYFKHYSETHYYEIWLKALELVLKIDNPNIIEIGCGPGQFANLLFDNGIKYYRGIDFSKEAIKYAKIRNDRYKDLFGVENAYTTNIFNEEYNTVIIFEVLEHVDEDLKILSRIRENSNVLFSVPNFNSEGHVRWFNSKQEIVERYKEYIDFEDILSFSVGAINKIFLIKGKIRSKSFKDTDNFIEIINTTDTDLPINKYDMDLFESLNQEYRSKPTVPYPPQLNSHEYKMKEAEELINKISTIVDFKDKKVLEIGCGGGYVSRVLARKYGSIVTGVDLYMDKAWEELGYEENLKFVVCDLTQKNPFGAEKFDLIISLAVWEHIRHPFKMLEVCTNLIKNEGQIFIRANQYRSAIASHLYRTIYFPYPQLLFADELIIEYCLKNGVAKEYIDTFYFVNKVTYGTYKEYFKKLDLEIKQEFLNKRNLDIDFYRRFEDKLGLYPIFDLELDFFNVLLEKRK